MGNPDLYVYKLTKLNFLFSKLKKMVETSELETKKSIWKHNEDRKVLQLSIETLKAKTNKIILE